MLLCIAALLYLLFLRHVHTIWDSNSILKKSKCAYIHRMWPNTYTHILSYQDQEFYLYQLTLYIYWFYFIYETDMWEVINHYHPRLVGNPYQLPLFFEINICLYWMQVAVPHPAVVCFNYLDSRVYVIGCLKSWI